MLSLGVKFHRSSAMPGKLTRTRSGGACDPVVAERLSEDPNVKILILEAGSESALVDNEQMPGAWIKCHYGPLDWNIVSPPQSGLKGRGFRLPRGRFLGGSRVEAAVPMEPSAFEELSRITMIGVSLSGAATRCSGL
jgi:hypothetical protein